MKGDKCFELDLYYLQISFYELPFEDILGNGYRFDINVCMKFFLLYYIKENLYYIKINVQNNVLPVAGVLQHSRSESFLDDKLPVIYYYITSHFISDFFSFSFKCKAKLDKEINQYFFGNVR